MTPWVLDDPEVRGNFEAAEERSRVQEGRVVCPLIRVSCVGPMGAAW